MAAVLFFSSFHLLLIILQSKQVFLLTSVLLPEKLVHGRGFAGHVRGSRGLIKSTGRWLVFSPALTAADL